MSHAAIDQAVRKRGTFDEQPQTRGPFRRARRHAGGTDMDSDVAQLTVLSGVGRAEGALLELAQVHLVGLHGGEVLHHPAAGGVERLCRDDDVTGD